MRKFTSFGLFMSLLFWWPRPCFALEALEVSTPNRTSRISHQVLENDMLVVSVTDEKGDPMTGLGIRDFVVQRGRESRHTAVR